MKYLEKAANLIGEARTEEKLDLQHEALEYVVREFPSAKEIFAKYDDASDMEERRHILWDTVSELDNIVEFAMSVNDDLDGLMDHLDEEEWAKEAEAERQRVHAMGAVTYSELNERFTAINVKSRKDKQKAKHESAIVYFRPTSYTKDWPKERLAYRISSDNKAFQPWMGGYSLYGSSLSSPSKLERLDPAMREPDEEYRWVVDHCVLEN